MNYVYAEFTVDKTTCRLGTIQNLDKAYELRKGKSVLDRINDDVHFVMDSRFPEAVKRGDLLNNSSGQIVVSEQWRDFFEKEQLKNNEIFPVRIVNHKGRDTKEKYFVIHQLDPQDCINLEESVYTRSEIRPEYIAAIDEIVIDESKIDEDVKLFRMKGFDDVPVFRRDLAEKLKRGRFQGLQFIEFEDWDVL